MNSKEENTKDFYPNYVQEFGLWSKKLEVTCRGGIELSNVHSIYNTVIASNVEKYAWDKERKRLNSAVKIRVPN